jgi:hypothetical protein
MTRWFSIAAALTLLLAASLAAWQDRGRAEVEERIVADDNPAFSIDTVAGLLAADPDGRFLGARSCAAAACHGGHDPDPRFSLSRRNEFMIWLDKDPHSRSVRTLQSEASQQILRRLQVIDANSEVRDQAGMANCFACHNPQPAADLQHGTFFTRDGVSCEMCHGPAEKWIGAHVTQDWNELKRQGSVAALGFLDTEDPLVRSRTCAQCHVGSPGREVNHDLIAAGHPVLKFEMSAYHDMLPKHWRDSEERQRNSDLEIELWSGGQLASAEMALELLAWRAQRAADDEPGGVWPELAEYDCYSCHHDLVHPSWRQQQAAFDRPLGMATWGSWYFGILKQTRNASLDALTAEMQRGFAVAPGAVLPKIESFQADLQLSGQLRMNLPGSPTPANWDEATQLYLALVAAEQAQRDKTHKSIESVTEATTNLRNELAFPRGFDSPRGVFSGSENSSREAISKSLGDLIKELHQRQVE